MIIRQRMYKTILSWFIYFMDIRKRHELSLLLAVHHLIALEQAIDIDDGTRTISDSDFGSCFEHDHITSHTILSILHTQMIGATYVYKIPVHFPL